MPFVFLKTKRQKKKEEKKTMLLSCTLPSAAPKCGCRRERRQGRNLGEASPSRYSPFVPGILASKYGCFQLTSDWVGGNVSTKAWLQSLEEGELRIYK